MFDLCVLLDGCREFGLGSATSMDFVFPGSAV